MERQLPRVKLNLKASALTATVGKAAVGGNFIINRFIGKLKGRRVISPSFLYRFYYF